MASVSGNSGLSGSDWVEYLLHSRQEKISLAILVPDPMKAYFSSIVQPMD